MGHLTIYPFQLVKKKIIQSIEMMALNVNQIDSTLIALEWTKYKSFQVLTSLSSTSVSLSILTSASELCLIFSSEQN